MQLLITHARFLFTALFIAIWLWSNGTLKVSSLHALFLETFNKKTKPVLYWIVLKGNTSRFGFAMQVLLSDIEEYLSSFIKPVVAVVFIFIL